MSDAEKRLEATLNYLCEAAYTALSSKVIGDADRVILQDASLDLHPDGQILRALLKGFEGTTHEQHRLDCLCRLIEASIQIASRGVVTGPARSFIKADTGEMRINKSRKDNLRVKPLRKAICDEAKKLGISLSSSEEFADSVHEGVRSRLKAKDKYPSPAAIRYQVRLIKKEAKTSGASAT